MIESPSSHGELPPPTNGPLAVLEQRVHRLEDAVAALQDTRQLEERLAERVTERVSRDPRLLDRDPPGLVIEARRHLLPAAIGMMRASTDSSQQGSGASADSPRQPWLLFDALTEARAMFRMFVDPRYRMGRWIWLASVGLFAAILTSWIWLPGTSILPSAVGTVLIKTVDLVLAFVLYKILSREARRYRAAFPDRSATPRL
jgi:hypothetical protein